MNTQKAEINKLHYEHLKFEVEVKCGDVFINGEFVDQLQWTSDSIGQTIAWWLDGCPEIEDESDVMNDISKPKKVENVDVVRCRDCQYFRGHNGKDDDYVVIGYCNHPVVYHLPCPSWSYCGYGKRKEN